MNSNLQEGNTVKVIRFKCPYDESDTENSIFQSCLLFPYSSKSVCSVSWVNQLLSRNVSKKYRNYVHCFVGGKEPRKSILTSRITIHLLPLPSVPPTLSIPIIETLKPPPLSTSFALRCVNPRIHIHTCSYH